MSLHGIPVVFWVKDDQREGAADKVRKALSRASHHIYGNTGILSAGMPNDGDPNALTAHDRMVPGEEWHLVWKEGKPPEPIDEDNEFDPNTGTIRRIV